MAVDNFCGCIQAQKKGTKIRRHTTVSKLGQLSPPQDIRDGRPQLTDMM